MPLWGYVLIAIGSWMLIAVLAAFVLARILGRIGREVTEVHELLDSEVWATHPIERAAERELDRATPKDVGVGETELGVTEDHEGSARL